ncbi:hypothetical protein [Sphingomonas sp. Leaf205]|uniref:hypothetical protein n=1 Tax=Sphingomonas sp. Leaf205 TaxID=2876551 RepID=UPI001E425886|nr:hypothetical protein [Sphingomonas sp. Leaf205]
MTVIKVGTNPAKLASVIRFHLSDLGAGNGHHEFEHLTRHLARARIASNILPATGPVSSGGDRGRDFETFDARNPVPGPPGSDYLARSTGDRRLVFACTLEKRVEAKIRKDVDALAMQDDVDEVVYFCEPNVPIARRLKLIDEAKAKGLALQIVDGAAIAEWLTEPDVFWIAQEYLHLPSDTVPSGELEQGYVQHRRDWQSRRPIPVSRSDFLAIKAGLRKATFDDDVRTDLLFWLDRMEAFIVDQAPRAIARDAMYEIAVANLRGKGDLTPVSHLVEDYFADVGRHQSIGQITDAVVLLTYCVGANRLDQYRTDEAALFARRRTLEELIERLLGDPGIGPGRRSGLLRMRGGLELVPAEPGGLRDYDRAFAFWGMMLDSVQDAPLYPIEEFVDHLTGMVEYVGETEQLLALAARADEILSKRVGRAAAGEKAIDRAFALIERDEPASAIRELQRAKAKWFSGEQFGGMLRTLLLLSELYGRLGLAYAAKYHAMAAAFIARHEDPARAIDMLPRALLEVLDAEAAAGNSLGYMQLFPVLLVAHVEHDPRPLDMDEHPRILENMGRIAALLGFLKRGDAGTRRHLDAVLTDWPPEIREAILRTAAERTGFWNEGSWDEAWKELEVVLLDRPFGDLGRTRQVRWEALGIEWCCEFANDRATTPGAEQLIAELQLAACAMAGRDLGIVPGGMTIRVGCDGGGTKLEFDVPDGGSREVVVILPAHDRAVDDAADCIALFGTILHCCSVLRDDALMASFDRSTFDPIFVGRPYAELHREFVPPDLFVEEVREAAPAFEPDRPFRSRAGDRIPWFDGPGPTYDHAEALIDIACRYRRVEKSLSHTLQRLRADEPVRKRLQAFHDRGMKDWEILGILSNVALNHRLAGHSGSDPDRFREMGLRLIDEPEHPDDALDPAVFSDDQLVLHAVTYLAAFLNGRGLRAPSSLVPEKLERFLVVRYRLREDDVEHADVFGWGGEQAGE